MSGLSRSQSPNDPNSIMIRKVFLNLLFLVTGLTLSAETSVWKVTSASSTLYIGGTFHMLRKSDFPLPPEFDDAYRNSRILVFETDLGRMQDPAVQQLMMTQGLLVGKTLEDVLSPETYRAFDTYCAEVGLSAEALKGLKPSIALLAVAMIELQSLGISEEGVDMHFYQKARRDQKPIQELEAVEEQIEFICSMGEGNEDAFVMHSIGDMESAQNLLPELIDYWRSGDQEGMKEEFVDTMKEDFPTLYESLLVERNRNWMPKIQALLKTRETEFILVGAAHLVGDDGILRSLEKEGYKIEQL